MISNLTYNPQAMATPPAVEPMLTTSWGSTNTQGIPGSYWSPTWSPLPKFEFMEPSALMKKQGVLLKQQDLSDLLRAWWSFEESAPAPVEEPAAPTYTPVDAAKALMDKLGI